MKKSMLNSFLAALLAVALPGCTGSSQVPATAITVQTSSGEVSAVIGGEGALVYRDIPFALPPEGQRRWAAPEPVETPERQIQTRKLPVMCPQPQSMAPALTVGNITVQRTACIWIFIPRARQRLRGWRR